MYMVFFISAFAHEYLLTMAFKHVFPFLFCLYMSVGTMYVFLTRRATSIFWNAFLWGSLLQGWGFLIVFYSLEWYARINCPRTLDSWVDHLMPRTFTCNIVSLQV
ncbi:Sterol O-acyltransferase 1, partial [Stegodyphus mimosarum]